MSVLILTSCFLWLHGRQTLKAAGAVIKTVYIAGAVLPLWLLSVQLGEESILWLFSGLIILMLPKIVTLIGKSR